MHVRKHLCSMPGVAIDNYLWRKPQIRLECAAMSAILLQDDESDVYTVKVWGSCVWKQATFFFTLSWIRRSACLVSMS